jgi:hypothetical protein
MRRVRLGERPIFTRSLLPTPPGEGEALTLNQAGRF